VGNLTWLQTLGLTAGTGLIGLVGWIFRRVLSGNLVPKATLDREKEISARWREIAETYAANDRQRNAIVARNNEILERVLAIIERAPWVRLDSGDGYRGSHAYDVNRTRQIENPPQPWQWRDRQPE